MVEIRTLTAIAEFHEVAALQRRAFGFAPSEAIPSHILHAIEKAGGKILGAFDRNNSLIGFAISLFAVEQTAAKTPYFLSHIVAVAPECRGQSIGFRLKQHQRQMALESGIAKIRWTFDPLIASTASFNLAKLGAVVDGFSVDEYGDLQAEYFHHMPTDRFLVTWDLTLPPVKYDFPSDAPAVLEATAGYPNLKQNVIVSDEDALTLSFPADHRELRVTDPNRAHAWQKAFRNVGTVLLTKRYKINAFRFSHDRAFGQYLLLKC